LFMRGRDGGRGDAGRDTGVRSVAIQGNLSCCEVMVICARCAGREWTGVAPVRPRACAGSDRAARARLPDAPAVVFPQGRLGVGAGGRGPPPARGRTGGRRAPVQDGRKDSTEAAWARWGAMAVTPGCGTLPST